MFDKIRQISHTSFRPHISPQRKWKRFGRRNWLCKPETVTQDFLSVLKDHSLTRNSHTGNYKTDITCQTGVWQVLEYSTDIKVNFYSSAVVIVVFFSLPYLRTPWVGCGADSTTPFLSPTNGCQRENREEKEGSGRGVGRSGSQRGGVVRAPPPPLALAIYRRISDLINKTVEQSSITISTFLRQYFLSNFSTNFLCIRNFRIDSGTGQTHIKDLSSPWLLPPLVSLFEHTNQTDAVRERRPQGGSWQKTWIPVYTLHSSVSFYLDF